MGELFNPEMDSHHSIALWVVMERLKPFHDFVHFWNRAVSIWLNYEQNPIKKVYFRAEFGLSFTISTFCGSLLLTNRKYLEYKSSRITEPICLFKAVVWQKFSFFALDYCCCYYWTSDLHSDLIQWMLLKKLSLLSLGFSLVSILFHW